MSSSIGLGGSAAITYGLNATLTNNAAAVHQQLNTLAEQASSGLVGQTYAALGNGANITLNLSPQITAINTYQNNINQVTGSMQLAQSAMSQMEQIAATFASDIPNLNQLSASEVDNVAANARDALKQVGELLDSQNGNDHIFGGQDSGNPPVPDPDNLLSSGFYTQINTAVSALATNGSAATIASTFATAQSNASGTSPFSTYMSQPASAMSVPVVQTGEGSFVQTGFLASANVAVASTGTSTTGSYTRDLMRALATLGSLSSSQVNDPNFAPLVQDVATSLSGVVTAMASDAGVLGDRQTALTTTSAQLSATATALTAQVSNVQDADMASTLSQLTAVQTQLQESYKLISTASNLSLVNFLPAA